MKFVLADLKNLGARTALTVLWNGLKAAENAEKFTCRVMQPGLISYQDTNNGVVLVTKDAIDKMSPRFVGKPVIDERHKDGLKPEDFGKVADGVITNTFWDAEGWMCYDVLIWNPETKKHMKSGDYGVSNAYKIKEFKGGGIHNAIPYDQEVIDGDPTHLAIVKHPRYNGASILLNSLTTGGSMKIRAWIKRVGDAVKNAIDPQGSEVEVAGKKVPLKMLIECWEAEEAEKAAQSGAAPVEEELGTDSTVPVGGKDVKISDMINAYKLKNGIVEETADEKAAREKKEGEDKAALEKKNAEDKEAADAKAKKDKEDADALEKKNADEKATADAKAKADKDVADALEKKNALDKAKADIKDPFWTPENQAAHAQVYTELKNEASRKAQVGSHFQTLRSAANERGGTEVTKVNTAENRQAEGKTRYGSVSQGASK